MAGTSRQRMAANSLTQRSQTILNFKQRIINSEHSKSSRIIEKEHEDRKRVLIKRKVNLKCHYTDISAERARTALKGLQRDRKEKKDKEAEQLPVIRISSIVTRRNGRPGWLTRSKSDSQLRVTGTPTGSNQRNSTAASVTPLTQTTNTGSLPSIQAEQQETEKLASKKSPKLSLQETEISASRKSPELSIYELAHCRYLRMPPGLQRTPVHRSLPGKLPQLSTEGRPGKQRTVTTGHWKEVP